METKIVKFRELLQDDNVDLDVYDDYADDCCEAYVGCSDIIITEKCEKWYGRLFDLDTEVVTEDSGYEYAIVLIDGSNRSDVFHTADECEWLHKKLKSFLRKAAGYCDCELYKSLFGID